MASFPRPPSNRLPVGIADQDVVAVAAVCSLPPRDGVVARLTGETVDAVAVQPVVAGAPYR
jgi:hypothetical protein